MRELAFVILGASIIAMAFAALGINRSRTPDGTYLAAILGTVGLVGLVASALLAFY
ncbi:MAG TPA: hypothetical protein VGO49_14810 [Bradyrhizobium sp.]|jgi:hypothetical protein|nr:hypothetical protein [Bradyrhizobium sp.]